MFSLYLAETNAKLRVRSILAVHGVVSGGTTSIYLFYDWCGQLVNAMNCFKTAYANI
jgi:hypothetical protein